MCFKIVDSISDELSFHSDLLMKVGEAWRYRIGNEIGKCESAAKAVNKLSINLQKSAGASGDKLSGEDAKTQFYSMIDKPFRDWLSQLDTSYDIDEYDERFLRHLALGYTKEMIANLKGMPFGVKSLEKRQNDLIGRLFGECERVGVNATRLVVRALELRILDIDNLEADEE